MMSYRVNYHNKIMQQLYINYHFRLQLCNQSDQTEMRQ
jgi:hypothetical protein